jgi:bacillithiol biosynthesis cysteine-adding enzyme BshC
MGSEDADLDELGHIYISGDKFTWDTKQTGAVGRMKVDKQLILLIERMAGQLEVHEFGKELVQLLKRSYKEGVLIQHATLQLVNELFKDFGLLVLVQDNTALKRVFSSIVKKELTEQFSHPIVEETITSLSEHYKPQAGGRELNMFYLTESKRERIEKQGAGYKVESLGLFWSEKEILNEVDEHPERFSPNVILRGVFQETILPNIAFIGGGGEIAYWLELQEVFEACNVPFPVLIIRNSFLLYEEAQKQLIEKLGFKVKDLFHSTEELVTTLVKRESQLQLNLTAEKEQLQVLYQQLKDVAHAIDPTLAEHTEALKVKALDKVGGLEKKMLRAEKRKFEAQKRQITKLRQQLFPQEELQERVDNFSTFFAKYGKKWLDEIYRSSLGLEQELAILQLAKTETLTQRA